MRPPVGSRSRYWLLVEKRDTVSGSGRKVNISNDTRYGGWDPVFRNQLQICNKGLVMVPDGLKLRSCWLLCWLMKEWGENRLGSEDWFAGRDISKYGIRELLLGIPYFGMKKLTELRLELYSLRLSGPR